MARELAREKLNVHAKWDKQSETDKRKFLKAVGYLEQTRQFRISINLFAYTGVQPATFARCIRGIVASDYIYHQIP